MKASIGNFGLNGFSMLLSPFNLKSFHAQNVTSNNIKIQIRKQLLPHFTSSKSLTIEMRFIKICVVHLWHWKFDYGVRVRAFMCTHYKLQPYRDMDFEIITPNNGYDDEVNTNYTNAIENCGYSYRCCMHIKWKWSSHINVIFWCDAIQKCHFNLVNLRVGNRKTTLSACVGCVVQLYHYYLARVPWRTRFQFYPQANQYILLSSMLCVAFNSEYKLIINWIDVTDVMLFNWIVFKHFGLTNFRYSIMHSSVVCSYAHNDFETPICQNGNKEAT